MFAPSQISWVIIGRCLDSHHVASSVTRPAGCRVQSDSTSDVLCADRLRLTQGTRDRGMGREIIGILETVRGAIKLVTQLNVLQCAECGVLANSETASCSSDVAS